ncbi:MAG: GNAT family N-acetyltransferase [Succinivibrio sp.]
MKIILETPRLILREMVREDLDALSSILMDERVMYAYNGPFSSEETQVWLDRQFERYKEFGFGLWAVILRKTGKMIGQCGITMQDFNGTQVPEIGYLFAYDYWHKGYATEAARACTEYGFTILEFDRLYSIIRDTNTPSINVAKRNNMRKCGSLVKHYRGALMPHLVMCTDRKIKTEQE